MVANGQMEPTMVANWEMGPAEFIIRNAANLSFWFADILDPFSTSV